MKKKKLKSRHAALYPVMLSARQIDALKDLISGTDDEYFDDLDLAIFSGILSYLREIAPDPPPEPRPPVNEIRPGSWNKPFPGEDPLAPARCVRCKNPLPIDWPYLICGMPGCSAGELKDNPSGAGFKIGAVDASILADLLGGR